MRSVKNYKIFDNNSVLELSFKTNSTIYDNSIFALAHAYAGIQDGIKNLSSEWDIWDIETTTPNRDGDVGIIATFLNNHNDDYVVYLLYVSAADNNALIGTKSTYNKHQWGAYEEPVLLLLL